MLQHSLFHSQSVCIASKHSLFHSQSVCIASKHSLFHSQSVCIASKHSLFHSQSVCIASKHSLFHSQSVCIASKYSLFHSQSVCIASKHSLFHSQSVCIASKYSLMCCTCISESVGILSKRIYNQIYLVSRSFMPPKTILMISRMLSVFISLWCGFICLQNMWRDYVTVTAPVERTALTLADVPAGVYEYALALVNSNTQAEVIFKGFRYYSNILLPSLL